MPIRHVVVDGSNIATEGRSLPSLAQLDQAVREFLGENPDDTVTVVVDASFSHRIDPSEVDTFEEAEEAGEVVSPPAGAIGRGDAFLLRIADRIGATVLSNDSFQEFHGEHDWLFEKGRLIGGKPVPDVGWIFTPRTPVRGPKSREAVKEAKRQRQDKPAPDAGATGLDLAAKRGHGRGKKVERAIATATEEAVAPDDNRRRRRRRSGEPPAEPVNEPLAFITFIANHPLGSEVVGTVDSFASHGAFIDADGARCYVPLSGMGEPPPRSAREVLGKKSDEHTFVVQALDPLRRGVELALPGFARVAGRPTDETVEAEIEPRRVQEPDPDAPAVVRRARAGKAPARKAATGRPAASPPNSEDAPATAGDRPTPRPRKALVESRSADPAGPGPSVPAPEQPPAPGSAAKKAPPRKAPAKQAAAKQVTAKQVPARAASAKAASAKAASAKAVAGRAVVGRAVAKKAASAKAASTKAASAKAASTKAASAKATAGENAATERSPATKAPAKKAPAKKAPAAEPSAKKVSAPSASGQKASGQKAAAVKPPAKKATQKAATPKPPAKQAPAKKAAARRTT